MHFEETVSIADNKIQKLVYSQAVCKQIEKLIPGFFSDWLERKENGSTPRPTEGSNSTPDICRR